MTYTQNLVAVLSHEPENVEDIVTKLYEEAQTDMLLVEWFMGDDLPEGMDVGMADQLLAYKRDAGEESKFLVLRLVGDDD